MTYSLIVAASENDIIGKDNKLPWHLPKDLKFFKNTTWAMPVVMGRKTWESMDGKALQGRINVIITRNEEYKAENAIVVTSLKDAEFVLNDLGYKEMFVIGGGELFLQTMDAAANIYLTRVHTSIEGDVKFPEVNKKKFKLASSDKHSADEKHAFDFTFEKWERD